MRALLLALALAGCASAAPPIPRERPTIVSLNPCTDAMLAEVADPGQILAISHYSHDPRSTSMGVAPARRFQATGGTAEEVVALAPDVVVASSFIAPATLAALTELGMRVETFGSPDTIAESIGQVRKLAALAGHPERGEALVRRIEASLARPQRPAMEAALWQSGGIVPGKGTLVADLMAHAGLSSYSAALGMAQGDYLPLERIAADPPALLLVAGEERGQRHPILADIPNLEVASFEPRLFYCGGPSIPRAMERLREVGEQATTGSPPRGEGLREGERAAGARPGSRLSGAPTQPSPERGRALAVRPQ